MSKRCAKCEKTVYPTEELKCLDKVWHKFCFKCWECGMTLNMKNYKGYDKKPYCNAHYPTTKFTVVADTPENNRIAQNTKIQSQVKYHEEFEKNIKGTKITVVDEPEQQRLKQNQGIVSQIEYKGLREGRETMEQRRANVPADGDPGPRRSRNMGSVADYEPQQQEVAPSPYSAKNQAHSTMYSSQGKVERTSAHNPVGRITDYDPLNEQWGSIAGGYNPSAPSMQKQEWEETVSAPQQRHSGSHHQPPAPQPVHQPPPQQSYQPPPQQSYQPPPQNQPQHRQQDEYGGGEPAHMQRTSYHREPEPIHYREEPGYYQQSQQPAQPQYVQQQRQPEPVRPSNPNIGMVFRAMYDYDAADNDEVSFHEGDLIIDTQPIDAGWMYGTVKNTMQTGMLPANYVEPV